MISTGFGKPLVEDHEFIDVRILWRRGALATHGVSVVEHGRDFRVTWTPCNYGGWRPWFVCPDCGQRVALLYVPGLVCRKCAGLAYRTQREDARMRAWTRVERLREGLEALGIDPEHPSPRPPRGMRSKRYARVLKRFSDARQRTRSAIKALHAAHAKWEARARSGAAGEAMIRRGAGIRAVRRQ